ncbi:MAG: TIGR03086 family metal-binding protein [Trebonia sp.]
MSEFAPLADLDRALLAVTAIVAGIGPGQWTVPTSCDVDVRTLAEHIAAGNLLFAALLRDGILPGAGTLGEDLLRDDPVAAFERAGAELADAFAAPGVLDRAFPAPPGVVAHGEAGAESGTVPEAGTVPGADLLHVRFVEILVHGWDIARATGQRADFPEDLAGRVLAAARRFPQPPPGNGSPFAPEVPVPAGAPAIERLAGLLGREV